MTTVPILGVNFLPISFCEAKRLSEPGVYLMAHLHADGRYRVHYAGRTNDFESRFSDHHRLDAAIANGARFLLAAGVPNPLDRIDLEVVLRYVFSPPINLEPRPKATDAYDAAKALGMNEVARKILIDSLPPLRPNPLRNALAGL